MVGLATLTVHLLFNSGYGFFRDELYYIACGEHLAFGYVDHPPLIALIAKASRTLLGESLPAFRFFPAVASAFVVFLSALMASEMGGGKFAQALAGICVLVGPIFLGAGNILSTIVFDQLFWVLCCYLLIKLLNTGDTRLFIWLGVAVGVGLMAKHNMAYFAIGMAIAIAATPARRHFRNKHLWLGGLMAAAIFLPNVWWQVSNGWPTLDFLKGLRASVIARETPKGLLLDFVMGVNPLTFPIALLGVWFYFSADEGKPYRLLGLAVAAVTAILVAQGTKAYYLAPLYPALLAGGGLFVEKKVVARSRKLVPAALIGGLAITGVGLAPLAIPVLPVEKLLHFTELLGMTEHYNFTGKSQRLPTLFADQFGWPELVDDIAGVHRSLSPEEQRKAAIYARNFGEAGAVDFFGKKRGLPGAISGNHNYFFWGPGAYSGEIVITVGEPVESLCQTFEDVELKAVHRHPYAMSLEGEVPIVLCKRIKVPLQSIWPQVRSGF